MKRPNIFESLSHEDHSRDCEKYIDYLEAEIKRCHEIMDNCQAEINTYFEKVIKESKNES